VEKLNKLLQALGDDNPSQALEELNKKQFFYDIPEILSIIGFGGRGTGHKDLWPHTKQVVQNVADRGGGLTLRMAALFHDAGKPFSFEKKGRKVSFHGHEKRSARLLDSFYSREISQSDPRYRNEFWEDTVFIVEMLGRVEGYTPDWTDSAVRRISKDLGGLYKGVVFLAGCDCTSKHRAKRDKYFGYAQELMQRIEDIREQDAIPQALPKGLGNLLVDKLGIPRGPRLGSTMKMLQQLVDEDVLPRNADANVYVYFLKGVQVGSDLRKMEEKWDSTSEKN
jgi:poly(A) polymerase